MDDDALLDQEMEQARLYWPQIYISLRAYANPAFILRADAWRELACTCLGARMAAALRRASFPLFPPAELIEKIHSSNLVERVKLREGNDAAFVVGASFNYFLNSSTSMESAVCTVARELLHSWL